MTIKNNGGPAFPFGQISETTGQPVNGFYDPGMTLRDYFASQVIGAAFSELFTGWQQAGEPVDEDWPMGLAIDAYRVADAMLAARENKS